MRLDIGGGESTLFTTGFVSIDINPKATIVHDLDRYPWPIKDNSVGFARMSHVLEHLENPLKAMKEIHRILKPDGEIYIAVPWWRDDIGLNPYHRWVFQPGWFDRLTPHRLGASKYMDTCRGNIDFIVIKHETLMGRIRFWKKYETRVWLKKGWG